MYDTNQSDLTYPEPPYDGTLTAFCSANDTTAASPPKYNASHSTHLQAFKSGTVSAGLRMTYVAQVLVGMIVMGILDVPMIKYVIAPTLNRSAPELVAKKPDVAASLIFYIGYVALVVFLSQKYGSDIRSVAILGALLGLLAYGTYELTNKAVIQGWPWEMVALDMVWGVVLTSAVATSVFFVFNR